MSWPCCQKTRDLIETLNNFQAETQFRVINAKQQHYVFLENIDPFLSDFQKAANISKCTMFHDKCWKGKKTEQICCNNYKRPVISCSPTAWINHTHLPISACYKILVTIFLSISVRMRTSSFWHDIHTEERCCYLVALIKGSEKDSILEFFSI